MTQAAAVAQAAPRPPPLPQMPQMPPGATIHHTIGDFGIASVSSAQGASWITGIASTSRRRRSSSSSSSNSSQTTSRQTSSVPAVHPLVGLTSSPLYMSKVVGKWGTVLLRIQQSPGFTPGPRATTSSQKNKATL